MKASTGRSPLRLKPGSPGSEPETSRDGTPGTETSGRAAPTLTDKAGILVLRRATRPPDNYATLMAPSSLNRSIALTRA